MNKADRLCGITCFYNLGNSEERLRNFATFRARWEKSGLPLLVIEWSPWGIFQLTDPVRDRNVHQISGGAICWQKERLLNIGLEMMLGAGYEKFICVDGDLVYDEDSDWVNKFSDALGEYDVVQGFSQAVCKYNDCVRVGESVVKCYREKGNFNRSSPGGVWGFNKAFATEVGWYEDNIIGGGDSCLSYSVLIDPPPANQNSKDVARKSRTVRTCTSSQWGHFVDYHKRVGRFAPRVSSISSWDS